MFTSHPHKQRTAMLTLCLLLVIVAGACAAPAPASAPASSASAGPLVNSMGVELPADAAPLDQQIFRTSTIEGQHFDVTRSIYETNGMQGSVWEPLVWLDADFNIYPGAADSWDVSADGLTWTFNLRQTAKWSDGTPITADDWVFSLQRMLSPEIANPYGWFYFSIKNAEAYQKGEVGVDELGVAKSDDYTLQLTTETPIPYFLQVVGFIPTIAPKHMIEQHGDAWAAAPETALSNGPFIITEWNKGANLVYAPNPQYDGPFKPRVEQVISTILPQADVPLLPMLQAGEIDIAALRGPQLSQALADPNLAENLSTYPAFTTFYMFFDVQNPPFNDLKVRQAFSHAIDREAIANAVMQGLELPAYTMLPAGFPCSQAENPEIQAIQAYDPALAQQLLAEAGYEGGSGFPELELWTRQGQVVTEAEAIQRMLQENLGVTATPKDQERSFYMEQLAAHAIPLGIIQWVQDYSDPTNFLDWWASGSRHNWQNERFIELINQARGELDPEQRCQMYQEAERILIEEVGGVFIGHPVEGILWSNRLGGLRTSGDGLRRNSYLTWMDVYIKQ